MADGRLVLKVKRWLRGIYDTLSVEAWHVRMPPDEWYDIYVKAGLHGAAFAEMYADSLDREEVDEIVRALKEMCEVEDESHYSDGGLRVKFRNCLQQRAG